MADRVQLLVQEAGHRLRREMDPVSLQATMTEIDGHLRERIAALTELGWDAEAAEAEAIQSFGDLGRFVQGVAEAHRPPQRVLDRNVLRVAIAALAVYTLFPVLLDKGPWVWCVIISLGLVVGVGATSFRARRIHPMQISGLVGVWFLALLAISPFLWMNLWEFGGMGYVRVPDANRYLATISRDLPIARMAVPKLEAMLKAYDAGDLPTANALLAKSGYRTRDGLSLPGLQHTREGVEAYWIPSEMSWDAIRMVHQNLEAMIVEQEEGIEAVRQASTAPYLAKVWTLKSWAGPAAMIALFLLLISNLVGGVLGRVDGQRRQRGPRRNFA